MKTNSVFKYAYDAYTHSLNGRSKEAIKSYTNMYREGIKNPTQAKFAMEEAHKKAVRDYDKTTNNSEFVTTLNSVKTNFKCFVAEILNKDYRKAGTAFIDEYNKLYPKTGFVRDMIIAERNMP